MICFVHIEKAAGTTIHHIFANNFPDYVHLKPWCLWSNTEENDFSRGEFRRLVKILPWTRAVGGHSLRAYLHYETALKQPIEYVTFVREPVSRYLSHFHYQRDRMKIGWTLESFCAEPRFNNYMTNRLSAHGDLDDAKRALREDFAFVGLMEEFDRSLLLLKQRLGLETFDTRYEVCNANRSGKRKKDEEIDSALRDRILENNALDLELYRYASDEVFPTYLAAAGEDLDVQVWQHLKANQGFRFPPTRQFLSKSYRKAVHRPVEKVLRRYFHEDRRAA